MRKLSGFLSKHKNILILVLLVAVSVTFVVATDQPAVQAPNQVGMTIVTFFQGLTTGAAEWVGETFNSIGKLDQLKKELAETRRELLEYKKASHDNVILREKFDALSRELDLAKCLDYEYIPVEIIAWGSQTDFSTLVVNKGSVHGLHNDMPVVAFSGGTVGLVGKVVSVGPGSAVIHTLLDPSCYVSAMFKDTRYKGIVSGVGAAAGFMEMDLVKKSALDELDSGAIVVTSGLGGLFPKDIPLGRWKEKYQAKDYETVIKLEIEPVLDFQKLEYLYVLDVGAGR